MTGIRELFAELSGGDEFDYWARFEQCVIAENERKRERERRYRLMGEDKRRQRQIYANAWVNAYFKRKLREDPEWAERRRASKRECERRRRARLRAERLAA